MQRRNPSEPRVRHNVTNRTSTQIQETTVRRVRTIHLTFCVIAVEDADTKLSVVFFHSKADLQQMWQIWTQSDSVQKPTSVNVEPISAQEFGYFEVCFKELESNIFK